MYYHWFIGSFKHSGNGLELGLKTIADERLLQSLEYNCGELIMSALLDKEVVEIMLNPDGKLWIEKYGQEQECIGEIGLAQAKIIISLVASSLDVTVSALNPVVEGSFPLDGSRFEGTYPPIVFAPSFTLRKKANKIMSLDEYLQAGTITQEVIPIIQNAITKRKNIMVVGGTSSGKTTFVNAVINELYSLCPNDRLLILEDTAELQSKSPNSVFFLTSELANIGMRNLTKICMRYAPKRILVGEVRDGSALELLKLWNTGHPGGIGTFHADGAEEALERLEELVEEAGNGEKRRLIGRAVDLIVFMEKNKKNQRQLSKIIDVVDFNIKSQNYTTFEIYKREGVSHG